jgi:hypothetical protein
MDFIEKALLDYSVVNSRIPCPSDLTLTSASANYGMEAGAGSGSSPGVGTGACTGASMSPVANFKSASGTVEGGVPTRALQLPDDYMYDGWGRKFRYAVDPTYTVASSLPVPAGGACTASTSRITVNDASGAARTAAGAYAIISHGSNGHGAYTSSGVVINAGSSSTDELRNCNCTAAGVYTGTYTPTYVQKAPQYDSGHSGNAAYQFDDIVTFKEAWQMQTQNFALGAAATCDVLAVGAGEGTTSPVYFYKLSGTTMTGSTSSWQYGLPYATYSPDGSLLYVTKTYSNTYVYSVASDGITTTGPVATIADPGNGDDQYDPIVSPDGGYFGIPLGGGGGGVQVYSRSGNTFTPLTDVVLGSNAGVQGETSLDASANHLALGIFGMCSGTAPAAPQIYKRSGTSFSLLVGQPDVPFSDSYNCLHTHAKFSPDGTYLYATDGGTDSLGKNFRIYAVSGDTFTYQSGQPDHQPETPQQIAVNASNTYIAVSNSYTSPYLYIYKRSGSTFTRLSNPATIPNSTLTDITFTPDGQYLAMTETNSPYLLVYKVNSATDTFTALAAPSLIPAGGAQSLTATR